MSSLKILLPLLAAPASSFAPVLNPSVSVSRASSSISGQSHVLRAGPSGDDDTINRIFENDKQLSNNDALERVGKVAASALFALTLSFSAITAPVPFSDSISSVPSANAFPSITIAARNTRSDDEVVIKELEEETREVEKEEKTDRKKAKVEKTREAFFEYEAKMAEQQEARIEAAEQKFEVEFEKDKAEAERLQFLEQKVEKDASTATGEEKAAKQKMAKALLKKEKELERKEKKAAKLEKVYLAEEQQEKKIVRQKEDAAIAEEKKFEAVEKEYEEVAELAQEEELELSLLKGFSLKKK